MNASTPSSNNTAPIAHGAAPKRNYGPKHERHEGHNTALFNWVWGPARLMKLRDVAFSIAGTKTTCTAKGGKPQQSGYETRNILAANETFQPPSTIRRASLARARGGPFSMSAAREGLRSCEVDT